MIGGSSSSSEIAYNEIYNNSFGIALAGGVITCYIHDNKIYNNNINPDINASGSGINVNGNSSNAPIITRNEIYGNWWGITIQNGTTVVPGPQPNIGNIQNADTTDDGLNIIYSNIQGANVYDLYNNCTNDIMAENNDWRVYDSVSIEQHIFHKVDVSAHGWVNFVPFSQFIPVELVSFTANQFGSNVILNWKTSSEKNNYGFEIERTLFNKGGNQGGWEKIGFVEGFGTTTEIKAYSFTDKKISNGIYKYRLKQIDFNGTFKYSSELEINIDLTLKEFVLYQNYPNPFNPTTRIKYAISSNDKREMSSVTFKVYDVLGREVATLVNEEKSAGVYEIEFSIGRDSSPDIASGIYFYQLKVDNSGSSSGKDFTETKKMILIK